MANKFHAKPTVVARYRPSEHSEQTLVIAWFSLACKRFKLPPFSLFAIPNAAKRSFALAAMLKAEGMRAGIPDLFLAARSGRDTTAMGLFIEMKRKPNKPSAEQLEVIDYLRRPGYHCVIAWNADEAIRAITAYLKEAT